MEVRRRDSLRISRGALLLVLSPLAVFIAGDALQAWIGWKQDVGAGGAVLTDARLRDEAAGRLTMMAGFLAAVSVGLSALFICASDLFRLFGRTARRQLLRTAAAAVALLVLWVFATSFFLPDIIHYLGQGFVAATLDRAEAGLSDSLVTVNRIVRVVFVLAGVGVIVGTISCLAEPVRTRPPWARSALRRLQRRRLQRYLNLGALVMTAGLLFMVAWMRWPAFGYDGEDHNAYVGHVNALALYFGVYYSAVIASYYVPVAAIMQSRTARALLGRDSSTDGPGRPEPHSAEVAGKGLAILLPAIAGMTPSLIDLLSSVAVG